MLQRQRNVQQAGSALLSGIGNAAKRNNRLSGLADSANHRRASVSTAEAGRRKPLKKRFP
ncbi:hypothetical protein BUE93_17910 [Chromobacterium amazonense]|uniref:Uncharacterized protein n=1 Tax=Chromobacterium amazonense TaxID=1382803 RepID=A0A2S9X0M7_9NEIS|nr:hypothetical protein BUE93_17910 [Chromobacterium amazonense]